MMNLVQEKSLALAHAYADGIQWISRTTGASDPMLHLHAGLALLLGSALISRRPLSSPVPIGCVLAGEFLNEVVDRVHHGRWMPDTTSDILHTILWPLAIFLIARFAVSRRGGSAGRSRRKV